MDSFKTISKVSGMSPRSKNTLQAAKADDICVVVVDNGHAFHKLAYFNERNDLVRDKYPLTMVKGQENMGIDANAVNNSYSVNGNIFTWVENSKELCVWNQETYQTSDLNFAGVAHGLSSVDGIEGKKIVLVTTIPIGQYFIGNQTNTALIEQIKKKAMESELVDLSTGNRFEVVKSYVMAEGFSALYDWLLDDNGQRTAAAVNPNGKSYLIVDIGGGTVDLISVTANKGFNISKAGTHSFNFGVTSLYDEVRKCIVTRSADVEALARFASGIIQQKLIESVLRTGILRVGRDAYDLSVEIGEIKSKFVQDIYSKTVDMIGSLIDSYHATILVGGGAVLLGDELSKVFYNTTLLNEFSTASGALKFIVHVMGEEALALAKAGG